MNVSMSPEIKALVKAQVATGRYRNDSEVVREELRMLEDQARQRRLEDLLLEGVGSGEPNELTDGVFEEMKAGLRRRVEASSKGL